MANGSDGEWWQHRMAMAANSSGDKRQQWQSQQWRMAAAAAVINPVAIPSWWKVMAPLSPAVETCGIELVAHGSGSSCHQRVTLPSMVAAVASTTMLLSMAPSSMDG